MLKRTRGGMIESRTRMDNTEASRRFQTLRGGRVVFQNIEKPEKDEWGSALEAFTVSSALSRSRVISVLGICDDGSRQRVDRAYSEIQAVLALEKFNNNSLLDLHKIGGDREGLRGGTN